MTLDELEVLVEEIQKQVELNTLAIHTLSSRFASYAPLSTVSTMNSTIDSNSQNITSLQTAVSEIQTSIGLVNKLSKLIDTNIVDINKDDLLQWDGDRWTNISPSELGITSNTSNLTLESLSDVSIDNKQDGQALCWSNTDNMWINKTVETGSGGVSGFDEEAMWEALAKTTSYQINPTHITGSLTLSGLTVNGYTYLNYPDDTIAVTVNGNLVSTGEVTAFSTT